MTQSQLLTVRERADRDKRNVAALIAQTLSMNALVGKPTVCAKWIYADRGKRAIEAQDINTVQQFFEPGHARR